jgi:hypothetical protein
MADEESIYDFCHYFLDIYKLAKYLLINYLLIYNSWPFFTSFKNCGVGNMLIDGCNKPFNKIRS